jgi:beta-1,4-mannosyltransferase
MSGGSRMRCQRELRARSPHAPQAHLLWHTRFYRSHRDREMLMRYRVAFLPDADAMSGNPYWPRLKTALQERGVDFDEAFSSAFSARSLWANRRSLRVLHFHFVQQFYAYEAAYARTRWVLRFARNILLARALGYRTVYTLHDLKPAFPLRPTWADYLGHWVAANLTDSVIVHCNEARKLLSKRFGRRRNVHVIPHAHYNGVYPNTVTREEARARLDLAPDHKVIAFIGGLRPNKGIETLIEAFRALPDKHLRLLIAGKPWPPREYAQHLMEASALDDRIQVRAALIPDEEMQLFLNACDVVALPFKDILTSGSAILSMSFGRAVVAPAVGCLPELITPDAGFLYDPHAPGSLEKSLRQCVVADLQGMGERARKRVERATWDTMAHQTLAAYGGA